MDNTSQDLQKFEQLLMALVNMLKFPEDVARSLIAQSAGSYKEDHSMKALLRHVQRGGNVECIKIDEEYAELFRDYLVRNHITFEAFEIVNDDGTKSVNFMYRDCDHSRVSAIKNVFSMEISNDSQEMSIYAFRDMMMGKQVAIASGLSLADIYAFRENVKSTSLKYVIACDNDGKYMIYANDSKVLQNVMVSAAYDIANDKDHSYQKSVETYAKGLQDIREKARSGEEFVIFDKNNPEHFLSFGPNGVSEHFIQPKEVPKKDGKTVIEYTDVMTPRMFDQRDILILANKLEGFKSPIMMSTKEFELLSHVDQKGEAFVNDNFEEIRAKIKEECKTWEPCVTKYPHKQPAVFRDDVQGLVNIPLPVVNNMMKEFDYITHDGTGNICYPKDKAPEIERYLQENVYRTLPPENVLAFDWMIHGRTGGILPDFRASNEGFQEFCILNTDRKITIDVTKDGIEIYDQKNHLIEEFSNKDPHFAEVLLMYINKDICPEPVILTAEEMALAQEKKEPIINERLAGDIENEAVNIVCDKEKRDKAILFHSDNFDELNMNPEQEAAVSRLQRVHIHEQTYTSSLFADTQDFAANRAVTRDYSFDLS